MSKDDMNLTQAKDSKGLSTQEKKIKAKLFGEFIDKKAKKQIPDSEEQNSDSILEKLQEGIEKRYKKDGHIVKADLEKQNERLSERLALRKNQIQSNDISSQKEAIINKQEARKETYIDKVAERATNYIKQEVEKHKSISSKEIEKICKSDGLKKIVESVLKKPEEQKLFQESVQKELKDITVKTAAKENKLSYWESFKKTVTNIFENVISVFQSKEQRAGIKDGMSSKMREILSKGTKKPASFAEKVEDMKKDANRSQRNL